MVDIDERVVQMKFDDSDFKEKTKSTFKVLDALKEKLSFKKEVSDSENLNAITENVQKMADKAYTIVDRMIDKIKDDIANKLVRYLNENTIGQIVAGWEKYANLTTSVATLKGQGYALEDINEQLDRLNYFTDETSYKFNDMVTEIGKFTAAGKSLEDSTLAMMGIANWAALSGKNANEASRAMYQLSQALGAGTMRMQDWKSIQNLNMDTREFRKNAIAAAIEVGTLKDNLDGTYTSLKNSKVTFTLNSFAESLTKGAWFTSDVMMEVFGIYASAVDEIREIYEEGGTRLLDGVEYNIKTTADALKYAQDRNAKIIEKFNDTGLDSDSIDEILLRWKEVQKVTDENVDNYAEMNKLSKDEARNELTKKYADYLKEYSEIFNDSVENAENALDDWNGYVSEFGMKAFIQAQEAKTFIEAIESAKDAASTVWTKMFELVFGNYDEARALWTDLANGLYDVFVTRLWNLFDIIENWKERGGRTVLFQGIYGFFGSLKMLLEAMRDAWDALFNENGTNSAANKFYKFSERFRVSMFRFYMFIKELSSSDFFNNIAASIKNILNLFGTIKNIIGAVIKQFIPKGMTLTSILVNISEKIKDITARLVPSQRTALNIARILRGIVSIFRLIGKVIFALFNVAYPIVMTIFTIIKTIINVLLEIAATIGDVIFQTESLLTTTQALQVVGEVVIRLLKTIAEFVGKVLIRVIRLLSPIIMLVVNTLKKFKNAIVSIFKHDSASAFDVIFDKFDQLVERIKKAWKSAESFGDIFNRFKEGKGLGNFLHMIGEMCMNVVQKIGLVIGAIIGLDEATGKSKVGKGINNFLDIMRTVGEIVKWIWTNLLSPVLHDILVGLHKTIDDIFALVRNGDLIGLLDLIKKVISTINTSVIFKILISINRLLGSGGILRIIRNIARTLKGLWRYFDAQALRERAEATRTFVISIMLLLGTLFVLANLSDETLTRMWEQLKLLGHVMVMVFGSILILSITAQWARGGLLNLALAFIALSITIGLTIRTIKTLANMLSSMDNKELASFNRGIQLLAVMCAGIVTMIGIFAIISRIAANVNRVGIVLIGLGVAFYGIAAGLTKMVELLQKYTFDEIAQALIICAGGILTIVLAIRLLYDRTVTGLSILGDVKFTAVLGSALSLALVMVVAIATFAFVLIPVLDSLAEKMTPGNFEKYIKGLSLFALTVLSIAGAIAMINASSGILGLRSLMSLFIFEWFLKFIESSVIPFMDTLRGINFDELIGGVTILALLINSIAFALYLVGAGIENIIEGFSGWSTGSILMIMLGLIGIVSVIMILGRELTDFRALISVAAALGVVVVVIAAMGFFIARVITALNGIPNRTARQLIQIIRLMLTTILAIGGVLTLAALGARQVFGNDTLGIIGAFGSITGALLLSIIGICTTFAVFIRSLTRTLGTIDKTRITQLRRVLTFMISILRMLVLYFLGLMAEGIFWNGTDINSFSGTLMTAAGSLAVLVGVFAISMHGLLRSIRTLINEFDATDVRNLNRILNSISIMFASIVLSLMGVVIAIGTSYGEGSEWMAAVDIAAIAVAVGVAIGVMSRSLQGLFNNIKNNNVLSNYGKYMAMIVMFGVVTAGIITAIGIAIRNIAVYQDNEHNVNAWSNALLIIVTFTAVVGVMVFAFRRLFAAMEGDNVSISKVVVIISVLTTMVLTIGEMAYLLDRLSLVNVDSIGSQIAMLGTMIAILGTITASVILLIRFCQDIKVTQVVVVISMLVSMMGTIALMGTVLIPSLSSLENINPAQIIAPFGGLITLILIMSLMIITIANAIDSNQLAVAIAGTVLIIASLASVTALISWFGDDMVRFFRGFKDIGMWDNIIPALASMVLIIVEIMGFGIALGSIIQENALYAVGIALMPVLIAEIAWSLNCINDILFEFFRNFHYISWSDIGAGLGALSLIILIFGTLGTLVGVLTGSLYGLNLVGMALIPLFLAELAWAIGVANPILEKFFAMMATVDWDTIWKGLVMLGGLGVILTTFGSTSLVAAGGIFIFIGAIAALSLVLMLLAEAITALRIAFGDESYLAYMEKLGILNAKAFNRGFAKQEGIKSQSKEFAKYGKYIDQGLAQGIKKNIPLVKKADDILADAVNDEFCEGLEIASPSKVFYENGRFIIAGLIGGMDYESRKLNNKGYNIGTSIADGISEGLDQANLSEKFDIWGGMNFEDVMNDVLGQNNESLFDNWSNTIFGEDEYEFDESKLTQEEKQKLEDLKKKREAIQKALNGEQAHWNGVRYNPPDTREESEWIGQELTRTEQEIQEIMAKGITKKNTGLPGMIESGFTDALTSAFGSSTFKDTLSGIGKSIGIDITGTISNFVEDPQGGLSDVANKFVNKAKDLFGMGESGSGTESGNIINVGKSIGGSLIDGIKEIFNSDNSIVSSIKNALSSAFAEIKSSSFGRTIMDLADRLGMADEDAVNAYLHSIGEKIEVEDASAYKKYQDWFKKNNKWDPYTGTFVANDDALEKLKYTGKEHMKLIEEEIYKPLIEMGIEDGELLAWSLSQGLLGVNDTSIAEKIGDSWVIRDYKALAKWIEEFWIIKSPSHRMQRYMEYIWEGGEVGTKEEAPKLLKAVEEVMKDVNNEFEETSEIQVKPKLTPVWDDTNIQSWSDALTSTIAGLNPRVDAVINSFDERNTYDYTPEFETLEKKLDTMTQLVCDAIFSSSEDTNVNINIEPDGDGLFKYMVNQVKMRNKRVPGSGLFG